jgi:ketosteroid isomerase-like protein
VNREQWVKEFFAVVDSRQPEKIAAYMTSNVRLQMANMEPSVGVEPLKAAFQAAADRFRPISHEIQGIWGGMWEQGDVVRVEAVVRYELRSGTVVELPCTSPLRLRGDKIADYRIFIEPSPAFADRWLAAAAGGD